MAHQASAHARRAIELPGAGLLGIAGREPTPTLTLAAAQEAARGAPTAGAVAAHEPIDAPLGQRLHQPGSGKPAVKDQHIARAQTRRRPLNRGN